MSISTLPPQQLRITCTPEEYEPLMKGEKSFEVKVTDPRMPVNVNDLVTIEEVLPNGEPTGQRLVKKASYVLNTAATKGYDTAEVAKRGLTIIGFVPPEHGTLASIYDSYFTMSVGVDRFGEAEGDVEEYEVRTWDISSGPHYAPAMACPPFVDAGTLEGLHIDKWPTGRYSITLLLYVDFDNKKGPPFEISLVDALAMVFAKDPDNSEDMRLVLLDFEALMADGRTIAVNSFERVTPLNLDEVAEREMEPMLQEDVDQVDDLLSEDDLHQYIAEAKARGEDVSEMELALAGGARDDYTHVEDE